MSVSPLLQINECAPSQVNLYATINAAIEALEQSANEITAAVDLSAWLDEYVVDSSAFLRNYVWRFYNQTTAVSIFVPSEISGNPTKRVIAVINESDTYAITLKQSDWTLTGLGLTVDVAPSSSVIVACDGIDVRLLAGGGGSGSGGGSSGASEIPIFIPGTPAYGGLGGADEEIFRYTFSSAWTTPTNFTGSVGTCKTNPTSDTRLMFYKKSGATLTYIGRVNITTAGVFTFFTGAGDSGATFSFDAGEALLLKTPNAYDPTTLANVGITIAR